VLMTLMNSPPSGQSVLEELGGRFSVRDPVVQEREKGSDTSNTSPYSTMTSVARKDLLSTSRREGGRKKGGGEEGQVIHLFPLAASHVAGRGGNRSRTARLGGEKEGKGGREGKGGVAVRSSSTIFWPGVTSFWARR